MPEIDVSVIIPTFHRPAQLLEAIGSVLDQAKVSVEVIVVDDSGDGSARSAVSSIRDSRVRYIAQKEPSGGLPALPRNEGARVASGRYLYFLDDDDLLMPGTLAVMSDALQEAPQAGMVFGTVEPFGPDERMLRHNQQYFARARDIARRLRGASALHASLVFRPSILVNSACMARRNAFVAVGGYDPDILICEDADLWGRIAYSSGGYVFLDRPVVRYRTGASSLMHNLAEKDEKLHLSYHRIQRKYRRAQGPFKFLARKIWARALLR